MGNAVFPSLPGLEWKTKRAPTFKTLVHEAVSGRETRVGLWAYPRYRWTLSYEFLRSDTVNAEWQTLMSFFLERKGSYDSFLFQDPDDYTVTGQLIGYGDGTTTQYSVVRTIGSYTEPCPDIMGIPMIYVDGIIQGVNALVDGSGNYVVDGDGNVITDGTTPTSQWTISTAGVITFSQPPPVGAPITADFSYYWRVRFVEDEAEFEYFMYKFWAAKKIELIGLK